MKIGRVEKRKKDTRQRIAHAALELFARQGIDATTIAEISEAADIGKGTFFTYFPTKEDVFVEVGTLILERIAVALQSAELSGPASAAQLLERALLPGIEWHQANPPLSRLSVAVMMRQKDALDRRDPSLGAYAELIASIIEGGKASGELRADADTEAAVDLLIGLYLMGILDWHQRGAQPGLLERDLRRRFDLVMRGLRA